MMMKKIHFLLLATAMIVSCGKNKGEKMLYDYQQKNVSALNFDLEDLDFKILKIEKLLDITASDSMKLLKIELAEYWTNNPDQTLVDTLSFNQVKDAVNQAIAHQDTMLKLYQESVLTAIRINDYLYEYESKTNRDQALKKWGEYKEVHDKIEEIENRYNEFAKNPDAVLSTQYKASYSYKNPIFGNVKQTFHKFFYTNKEQTEFVREESIDEE